MAEREIPFGRPWINDDDRRAVMAVLEGHILTHGPQCRRFEAEFVELMGGGGAVSTSSCMASLHLASLHFGLGPGDEVIVPAMTHVATVHAVELVGATPVFADCELTTGNIDLDGVERLVTDRTKAISLVHFAGIPVQMDRVRAIADAYDLKVIEDCALALGGRYKGTHVGLWGDAGCFSFYPVKHITTGEGGMFVSKDAGTVEAVASFRAFSVDRTHTERKLPGIYDVTGVGMNYRMSEMQAALGCSQLAKMPEIERRRAENFAALKAVLSTVPEVAVLDAAESEVKSSHYCVIAVLSGKAGERRNDCIDRLRAAGVGTSVYYPHPVPRMRYYRNKYGYDATRFPNAEAISDRSIALPAGPHLSSADAEYIGAKMKDILRVISQ